MIKKIFRLSEVYRKVTRFLWHCLIWTRPCDFANTNLSYTKMITSYLTLLFIMYSTVNMYLTVGVNAQ